MATKVIPPKELLEATTGGLSVLIVTGGSTGDVLTKQSDGTYIPVTPSAASGDVVGPASSTNLAVVTFGDTTGKLVKNNSGVTINSSGHLGVGIAADTTYVGQFHKSSGVAHFKISTPSGSSSTILHLDSGSMLFAFSVYGDGSVFSMQPTNTGSFQPFTMGVNGQVNIGTTAMSVVPLIVNCSTAVVGLIIKAGTSPSANLTNWMANDGTTVLSAMAKNGAFKPASLADSAAENGTTYYSTDAGKLVFKDYGGTVNNLY